MRNKLRFSSALCLLIAASVRAADAPKPRVMRFGINPHENQGHASPYLRAAAEFKAEVEKAVGSRLTVEIVDMGKLFGMRDKRDDGAMDALAAGSLDIAGVTTTALARRHEPRLHLFDLPFAFANAEQVERVVAGPLGEKLASGLPAKGLRALAYTYSGGFRVVAANRPIRSLKDLAGLRVWVAPSPYLEAEFAALGAVPVAAGRPKQLAEAGKIDAEENTYNFLEARSDLQKSFPYLNEMQSDFYVTVTLASAKFLDSLDAGERAAVLAAAKKAAASERSGTLRDNAEIAERLVKRGMTRVALTAEARAELAKRAAPVLERYSREVDATVLPEVRALERRSAQTASR
jgi:C4-dicarboxylate-binding protein DctP